MATYHKERVIAERNRLIADCEWLRRMMCHLNMQTDLVDQQLIELENLLPDDYNHPADPPKASQ